MQWLKLTCNSWSSDLLAALNEMRKDGEGCDVRIILQNDIELKAHSNVLSAASPFFKSILTGTENPEVNMQDFPTMIVECVLDFIYTGCTSVKRTDLLMLHSVATSLNVPTLADMSQKMVQHSMPVRSRSKETNQSQLINSPTLETSMESKPKLVEKNTEVPPLIIMPHKLQTKAAQDLPQMEQDGVEEEVFDSKPLKFTSSDLPTSQGTESQFTDSQLTDSQLNQSYMEDTNPTLDCTEMDSQMEEAVDEDDLDVDVPVIKMEVTEAGLEDVDDTDDEPLEEDPLGNSGGQEEGEHSYAVGDSDKPDLKKVIGNLMQKKANKVAFLSAAAVSRQPAEPVKLYSSPSKTNVSAGDCTDNSSYVFELYDEDASGEDSVDLIMKQPRTKKRPKRFVESDREDSVDESEGEDKTIGDTKYKVLRGTGKDGKDCLVASDGYSYIFHREGTYGKFWRCDSKSGKGACAASVKQHNDVFVRGPKPHGHGPSPNILTIKWEHGSGSKINVDLDYEENFSAYSVGSVATKTYRVAQKASRRGYDLLIDSDGYKYTLRKKFKSMTVWHCSVRSKTCSCHATVIQKGKKFVEGKQKHIHPPESNKPFGWKKPVKKPRVKDFPEGAEPVSVPAIAPSAPNQDIYGAVYTEVLDGDKAKLHSSAGYTFSHRRQGVHSIQWRCNTRVNERTCPASVRQYNDMFVLGHHGHIHAPNVDLVTTPDVKGPNLASNQTLDLFSGTEVSSPRLVKKTGNPSEGVTTSQEIDYEGTPPLLTGADGKIYKMLAKATQAGGDLLVCNDGYKYTVKRREEHRITWKCSVRNYWCKCAASVIQFGNMCREGKVQHLHAPGFNKPYGMENISRPKAVKPKVERRTHHEDDGFRGNPFEDEYGNKYTILEKASKTRTDKLVCSDGYSYTARRIGVHGVQWKCTQRHPPTKCLGSVRQLGDFFVRGMKSHTHLADASLISDQFGCTVQTTPTMYTSNGKTYSILHRASKAGKNVLEDSDGYRYNFKSASPNCIHWRCAMRNAHHTCSATVKQIGDTFIPGKSQHQHLPLVRMPEDAIQSFMEPLDDEDTDVTHRLVTDTQLQSDANNVVELVLVGEEADGNYEFTTVDGQTTFQLPPGMVIHHM